MKQIPIVESVIKELNPLQEALYKCKKAFWITFWIAFCVNMLMLITPLYSLQVLDRVLGSGNMSTLLMLSIIIASIYAVYGLLQVARSFTLIKIGEWLDNNVSPIIFSHSIASASKKQTLGAGQLLRDFQSVKSFMTSTGINTIFDMPWTIAYIAVIFMIHPYIGFLTIGGGVIIVILALFNAVATNKTLGEANEYSIKGLNQAEIATRNAEAIEAMGMMNNVSNNWKQYNVAALSKQSLASYRNGIISNLSRFIRHIIQMSVTAISAYVIVSTSQKDMSTGGMIASSILVGKALAPFDNAIELWKTISYTMKSYARLNQSFQTNTLRDDSMPIPNVKGDLIVNKVDYFVQEAASNPMLAMMQKKKQILKNVSFAVNAGEIIAIIGPSAAGKSTLAKIIAGVWSCHEGNVTLDGGDVYKWNREDFGKHVGYVPQGIELFGGTIKQNIARMSDNIDPEKIIEASKIAGAHDVILKLPNGYDEDIGVGGSNLSGGQKQRVALARAFYGNPKLVILDEPNANLDEAGEIALSQAIENAKKKNISVIVISHRPSILNVVNKILILQNGQVAAFGTAKEVEERMELLKGGTIHFDN